MIVVLGLVSVLFLVKGLGGAFGSLFHFLSLDFFHLPLVAGGILVGLGTFFIQYREPSATEGKAGRSQIGVALVLILIGIGYRIHSLSTHPMDVGTADMLFTITSQIDDFLSGNDPYAITVLPDGRTIPRYYFPVLWLSYLPLRFFDLDIRWLNLIAQSGFFLLLLDFFSRRPSFGRLSSKHSWLIFYLLLGVLLFSKQSLRELWYVQTGPFWLYYTGFLWSVSRKHLLPASILLSLTVACRHSAVLLFIPYAIFLFRRQRLEFWRALSLIAVLTPLLIFTLMDFSQLREGIRYYTSIAAITPLDQMNRYPGLVSLLKAIGGMAAQPWLQVSGLVIGVAIAFHRKTLTLSESLALGGLAYVTLMVWVTTAFAYIYAELLILTTALLCWPPFVKKADLG